jgi:hypothetical protein
MVACKNDLGALQSEKFTEVVGFKVLKTQQNSSISPICLQKP